MAQSETLNLVWSGKFSDTKYIKFNTCRNTLNHPTEIKYHTSCTLKVSQSPRKYFKVTNTASGWSNHFRSPLFDNWLLLLLLLFNKVLSSEKRQRETCFKIICSPLKTLTGRGSEVRKVQRPRWTVDTGILPEYFTPYSVNVTTSNLKTIKTFPCISTTQVSMSPDYYISFNCHRKFAVFQN